MRIIFDSAFLEKLKKVDVRVRNITKEKLVGKEVVAYFIALGTYKELHSN